MCIYAVLHWHYYFFCQRLQILNQIKKYPDNTFSGTKMYGIKPNKTTNDKLFKKLIDFVASVA